jgi:recombinational DNA repair ATPase RecF
VNPTRLRATNYRTFPTLDLHLPAGCVGVVGANGAGKSSIVSAIDTCLFGPDGRSLEPYLAEGSVPGDTLTLPGSDA